MDLAIRTAHRQGAGDSTTLSALSKLEDWNGFLTVICDKYHINRVGIGDWERFSAWYMTTHSLRAEEFFEADRAAILATLDGCGRRPEERPQVSTKADVAHLPEMPPMEGPRESIPQTLQSAVTMDPLCAAGPAEVPPSPGRPKKSTERGDGRAKLIAALTKHHKYSDGGCLNTEPIGNNALARAAGVSKSTASDFFKKKFHRHGTYKAFCRDVHKLSFSLKLLNDECAPHNLYGRRPADEDDRDDE